MGRLAMGSVSCSWLIILAILLHSSSFADAQAPVDGPAAKPAKKQHSHAMQDFNVGGIRLPPSGEVLRPECVPKYVTDLVTPPPMDVNSAERTEGPGCYNFSGSIPPECPPYPPPPPPHKPHDYQHNYPSAYPHRRQLVQEGEEMVVETQGNKKGGEHKKGGDKHKSGSNKNGDEHKNPYYKKSAEEHTSGDTKKSTRYDDDDDVSKSKSDYKSGGGNGYKSGESKKGGDHDKERKSDDYWEGTSHESKSKQYPDYPKKRDGKKDDFNKQQAFPDLPGAYPPSHKYDPSHSYNPPGAYPPHNDYYPHNPPPPFPPQCIPPKGFKEYQISAKQHTQEVLPVGVAPLNPGGGVTCPAFFDTTEVFAYGPTNTNKFNWPAFSIESQQYTPNRIQWVNELVDASGNFRPHILDYAIDQTIHWANPEALGGSINDSPCMGCPSTGCTDNGPCSQAAGTTYSGPVPIVTHVHGMEDVRDFSDGYTEAWYLPNANNLPNTVTPVGTWYNTFGDEYNKTTCQPWTTGAPSYIYPNTQRPSTSWYHDHALGLTRLNVYAGLAGFYFVRKFFPTLDINGVDTGPELPGLPYPPPGGANNAVDILEIPLAIQDRVFESNSQLWYPQAWVNDKIAYPNGNQPPVWIPEFLFNTAFPNPMMMTVNGKTWPKKDLAPNTYRLRLLNGCNARVLKLQFLKTPSTVGDLGNANTAIGAAGNSLVPFYVIGNEAGFFPKIQGTDRPLTELVIGQAERYDVIIDLSAMTTADAVYMINTGPENPYDGTNYAETNEFTSQLMRFSFGAVGASRPPSAFNLPDGLARQTLLNAALAAEAPVELPPSTRAVHQMALVEENNAADANYVKAVLLGTVDPVVNPGGSGIVRPQPWMDPIRTATPTDTTEEWDIINLTPDAHPIHLHEVVYQIVGRFAIRPDPLNPELGFSEANPSVPVLNPALDRLQNLDCAAGVGACRAFRDTAQFLPSTRTRIRFRSGPGAGLFVWHCHLVEHEDNEMMVPWCIGNPGYANPKNPAEQFCPPAL